VSRGRKSFPGCHAADQRDERAPFYLIELHSVPRRRRFVGLEPALRIVTIAQIASAKAIAKIAPTDPGTSYRCWNKSQGVEPVSCDARDKREYPCDGRANHCVGGVGVLAHPMGPD
jgi:hypothetical protein